MSDTKLKLCAVADTAFCGTEFEAMQTDHGSIYLTGLTLHAEVLVGRYLGEFAAPAGNPMGGETKTTLYLVDSTLPVVLRSFKGYPKLAVAHTLEEAVKAMERAWTTIFQELQDKCTEVAINHKDWRESRELLLPGKGNWNPE